MLGVPYHFLIVHFPLVLVLLALFYDARGEHDMGYRLGLGAAASLLLAVVTGLMLAGGRLSQMTVHAGAGIIGGLATLVLAMLRYARRAREEGEQDFPAAWLAIEIAAALCIVIAAVSGHRAVLGY